MERENCVNDAFLKHCSLSDDDDQNEKNISRKIEKG